MGNNTSAPGTYSDGSTSAGGAARMGGVQRRRVSKAGASSSSSSCPALSQAPSSGPSASVALATNESSATLLPPYRYDERGAPAYQTGVFPRWTCQRCTTMSASMDAAHFLPSSVDTSETDPIPWSIPHLLPLIQPPSPSMRAPPAAPSTAHVLLGAHQLALSSARMLCAGVYLYESDYPTYSTQHMPCLWW